MYTLQGTLFHFYICILGQGNAYTSVSGQHHNRSDAVGILTFVHQGFYASLKVW
jgi:hypothetical protein